MSENVGDPMVNEFGSEDRMKREQTRVRRAEKRKRERTR
jgi:hypothetical protein